MTGGFWLPKARTLAIICLMGAGRSTDVTILGGCGHVGLPLGLTLADAGLSVVLYDTNLAAVDTVRSGKMPHLEPGATEVLARTLADGRLTASADVSSVAAASTWSSWSAPPSTSTSTPIPRRWSRHSSPWPTR